MTMDNALVAGGVDATVRSPIRPGPIVADNISDVQGERWLAAVADDRPRGLPIASVSVVVPVYNEEGNLPELQRRVVATLAGMGKPFELLFVDDGSTDGTWAVIVALAEADERIAGVRLRRNFGKARALTSGFAVARGEAVVTMDGDLQDDPDEMPRFLDLLDDGNDLVSGWKQRRQDPLGKTLPSRVFNLAVRRVSGVPLHDFNCGYKAYRREVIGAIRIYGELHRFTPVLAHAEGFRIAELPVRHHPRRWGSSKYGWSRLVKGFLDLLTVTFLTQYRQRPMHVLGLPGLIAFALGVFIGLFLTVEKVATGAAIGTRPMLLLAVLLVVIGVQFFGLGLIGELLAHGAQPVTRTANGSDRLSTPSLDLLPIRDSVGVVFDRVGFPPSGE